VWYGETLNAKQIGKFLVELITWARETSQADVSIEATDEEINPLEGYYQRFVGAWPGPAGPDEADELFPDGWRRAAADAAEVGAVPERLTTALGPTDRDAYRIAAAEQRTLAVHLVEQEATLDRAPEPPTTVSVSGAIDYGRCPKRFYWSAVRPLPRFSGPAARIGTEVHAWIERRSSGQASLLELDEAPDLTSEELSGEPGKIDRLRTSFLESRFADSAPLYVERPFLLPVGDRFVGGRIDAIYGSQDGPWEVVDYKTGRKPAGDDPFARAQLDLYALACIDVWGKRPGDLTLTYLYLASADEVSHAVDDPDAVRARVADWLRGISDGAFDPTPGEHCRWCDFRPFCDTGSRWVEQNAGSRS
jgi:DNA helicase-2/ATP-dependent DNA helicase PcrA